MFIFKHKSTGAFYENIDWEGKLTKTLNNNCFFNNKIRGPFKNGGTEFILDRNFGKGVSILPLEYFNAIEFGLIPKSQYPTFIDKDSSMGLHKLFPEYVSGNSFPNMSALGKCYVSENDFEKIDVIDLINNVI
jgi:hypothetical protein